MRQIKFKTLAVLVVLFVGVTSFTPSIPSEESKTWEASDKAKKFVKETIVLDWYAPPYGVGWNKDSQLHTYMERAIKAGITGASITISPTYYTWEQHQKEHAKWRSTFVQKPEHFIFVHSTDDIKRAHREGKYAVLWNNQTSTIIDGDLTKVATLREMGMASMQIVYNGTYRAGDGCISYLHGEDRGLTDWGKKLIDEMVYQGIVVDLSHNGRNTCADIITYMNEKHPGVPVFYTHSVPKGLYENGPDATEKGCYRNITDEQAIGAAKTGGVVSPTFTEWMMDGIWPDDITPKQCADMVDYYAKLIGVDHVGIASDDMFILSLVVAFAKANPGAYQDHGYMMNAFDKGANGCGEFAKILPAVTDELWKMGYSDEDIAKFYGGNIMRVYDQVWK